MKREPRERIRRDGSVALELPRGSGPKLTA